MLQVAAVFGCLMFHVQHTFPELKREYNRDFFVNGYTGSTYLELPAIIKFFTHGIEYHHIHHLNIKIPGYKLQKCFEDAEKETVDFWKGVKRVCLFDMFKIEFIAYDEARDRLINRKEAWEELKEYTIKKLD